MGKRIALVSALIIALTTFVGAGNAQAKTSKSAFDFHAGDGFGPLEEPDEAQADNGDFVVIRATGSLDAGSKSASGTGTFEHHAQDGTPRGSGHFDVLGLSAFQFYGCDTAGGEPSPPNLCGGRALLPVHIVAHPASGGTVELDGTLEVTHLLGTPPAGPQEGVRFNIKDHINFNKSIEGETVLVSK